MASTNKDEEQARPLRRFSPAAILVSVMLINLVNCADRFSVGVLLDQIKVEVHVSDMTTESTCLSSFMGHNTTCVKPSGDIAAQCTDADSACQYHHPHCLSTPQLGFISSTFLIGLMLAAPIFASLDGHVQSSTLLFVSLVTWICAVLLTGVTSSYQWLLVARIFTGAAEAAFYTIVYPYISHIAPPEQRGLWVAYLASTTPVGAAIGFGLAGAISSSSWRYIFYLNAGLMAPLALLCLCFPSFERTKATSNTPSTFKEGESDAEERTWLSTTKQQLMACLSAPTCMALIMGYSMRNFVSGAYSYWGFHFIIHTGLSCNRSSVSIWVGAVTSSAGVLGAMTGGLSLDFFRDKGDGVDQRAGLQLATRIVTVFAVLCAPFMLLVPAMTTFGMMLGVLFVALFLLFCGDAVVTNAIIWSVPPEAETMAMALMNVLSHALGDVTAGPVVGWFQETAAEGGDADSPASWRTAFYLCGIWSFLTIMFYLRAVSVVQVPGGGRSKQAAVEERALLEEDGNTEAPGQCGTCSAAVLP